MKGKKQDKKKHWRPQRRETKVAEKRDDSESEEASEGRGLVERLDRNKNKGGRKKGEIIGERKEVRQRRRLVVILERKKGGRQKEKSWTVKEESKIRDRTS